MLNTVYREQNVTDAMEKRVRSRLDPRRVIINVRAALMRQPELKAGSKKRGTHQREIMRKLLIDSLTVPGDSASADKRIRAWNDSVTVSASNPCNTRPT